MSPDTLLQLVIGLAAGALIVLALMSGAILLVMANETGKFDRVKRALRHQPIMCPDCGNLTEMRGKKWACRSVPDYAALYGRCHNLYPKAKHPWTALYGSSTFPYSSSMALIGIDGNCIKHAMVDLDCQTCMFVLRSRGIEIE